jgi:hypothetical protein
VRGSSCCALRASGQQPTRRPSRVGRDLAAWLGLVPRQGDDRGQAPATRHHQTRQQIFAQDADPKRSRSLANLEPRQRDSVRGCAVPELTIRLLSHLPPRWRAPFGRSCAAIRLFQVLPPGTFSSRRHSSSSVTRTVCVSPKTQTRHSFIAHDAQQSSFECLDSLPASPNSPCFSLQIRMFSLLGQQALSYNKSLIFR